MVMMLPAYTTRKPAPAESFTPRIEDPSTGHTQGGPADPGTDPARRKRFHKLVLSGDVCYLNAYPMSDAGRSFGTARHQRCYGIFSSIPLRNSLP